MVADPQDFSTIDIQARNYILELKKGKMPFDRPENFGDWESVVSQIESFYVRCRGDAEKLSDMIDSLCRFNSELADLLVVRPSLEEVLADDKPELDYPQLPESVQIPPHLARGACRFLDIYEAYSKEASPEGYSEFHVFCGLWLLSTVSARRVFLQLRKKRFYGNLMIALCADTSMVAKSQTARVAIDLLYDSGLSFFLGPDRATPQKLISNMTGKKVPLDYIQLQGDKKAKVDNKIAMAGQRGLFMDEFGKFIQGMLRKNSTTADFAELFLTMDNCPPEYSNETLSRGSDVVENPFLSILGAMTYANLKENSRAGADLWTDGFWARVSCVAAPSDVILDAPFDDSDLVTPPELIMALYHWHDRLGVTPCEITEKEDKQHNPTGDYEITRGDLPQTRCTIDQYALEAWKKYRSSLKKMLPDFKHKDFHGSYIRIPETAMRMAVLMASLENNNHIEFRHWAKAQELAEILRKNLHILYAQVNRNDYVSDTAKAEDQILNKMKDLRKKGYKDITIAVLKGSFLKNYSIEDLTRIMEGMVKGGVLKKEVTKHATKGKYSLVVESEEQHEQS